MIIDCISDLHGFFPKLDGGDLLIVAGDLTARDTLDEHLEFIKWCAMQYYRKIIYIAGNHDNSALREPENNKKIEYLCDSGTEFEGLKIWGSPWTKTFEGMNPKCKAFTVDTEEELSEKWKMIPDDIDILVTHSPPFGIFDVCIDQENPEKKINVGSTTLSAWIRNTWKRFESFKIHVFGHIHEDGGKTGSLNMVQFINASIVNENYKHVNKPVRVVIGKGRNNNE